MPVPAGREGREEQGPIEKEEQHERDEGRGKIERYAGGGEREGGIVAARMRSVRVHSTTKHKTQNRTQKHGPVGGRRLG